MLKFKAFQKFKQALKQQNWTSHFIELIIVILGIFIAYQFAMMGERHTEKQQYLELIKSVKLENDKNREEFESLKDYRKNTLDDTYHLLKLLGQADTIPLAVIKDSIESLIIRLYRISTPDLQMQALESLINANFSGANLKLKREALQLKALYDEWLLNSNASTDDKQRLFFFYLYETVDFYRGAIRDYKDILSLTFKNHIWEICGAENEQSKLYNMAFEQFDVFDEAVLEELKEK